MPRSCSVARLERHVVVWRSSYESENSRQPGISRKARTALIHRWLPVYKNVAAQFACPCIALHSTAMAKVRGRRKQLMMQ